MGGLLRLEGLISRTSNFTFKMIFSKITVAFGKCDVPILPGPTALPSVHDFTDLDLKLCIDFSETFP